MSLCGFVVTAVTAIAIPSQVVWFGILNLLGISMLICSALKDLFNAIPTVVGAILSFMLYAVTYGVPTGYIGFLGIPIIELPSFCTNINICHSWAFVRMILFQATIFR